MSDKMTISQKFTKWSDDFVKKNGTGEILSREDIYTGVMDKFHVPHSKKDSYLPSDYCYNRTNAGINFEKYPALFEYLGGQYKCLGPNFPYNGKIYRKPKGEQEICVGQCINGVRYITTDEDSSIMLAEELDSRENIVEGARKQIQINSFERSLKAREACIKHYGNKCAICGFDFSKVYGKQFKGKIVVHHVVPISDVGEEYIVDPIKDLRPVCSNCHLIIHSKREAYTIEEVKGMLNK